MPMQDIDAHTLKNWLDRNEAVLVDVREPAEYASEHIHGAALVPLGTVYCPVLPAAAGRKIVIHCRKGGRGANACQKIVTENPGLDVYNLKGGIESWMAAGLPVERGTKRMLPLDRQVQLAIGVLLLAASALGAAMGPALFWVTGFIGAGLTVAGTTGFCGLARVLALMPWNRACVKTTCRTK